MSAIECRTAIGERHVRSFGREKSERPPTDLICFFRGGAPHHNGSIVNGRVLSRGLVKYIYERSVERYADIGDRFSKHWRAMCGHANSREETGNKRVLPRLIGRHCQEYAVYTVHKLNS